MPPNKSAEAAPATENKEGTQTQEVKTEAKPEETKEGETQ